MAEKANLRERFTFKASENRMTKSERWGAPNSEREGRRAKSTRRGEERGGSNENLVSNAVKGKAKREALRLRML